MSDGDFIGGGFTTRPEGAYAKPLDARGPYSEDDAGEPMPGEGREAYIRRVAACWARKRDSGKPRCEPLE